MKPELKDKLIAFIKWDNHPSLDERVNLVYELTGLKFEKDHIYYDFYRAPASTRFHGDYEGGLIKHSVTVYYCALLLAEAFDMKPEDIDVNACVFHDLVKANLYKESPRPGYGPTYTYNTNAVTLPHGSESVRRMRQCNIPLKSEAWEMAVAYHMGAFEHDNMEMYGRACDKYKEVLLLHTADMMATKIYKN